MAEQYTNYAYTTVAGGGYTAGSGILNVLSTGTGSGLQPFPGGPSFSVTILDQVTKVEKTLLQVTGINSGTQFATTNNGITPDVNCNAGDIVQITVDSRALSAIVNVGHLTLISRQVLGSPAASVTFSSIPQIYNSLKLVITARGDTAAGTIDVDIQFNGDTGNNYTYDFILEQNAVLSAGQASSLSAPFIGNISAASALANVPGIIEALIPNYTGGFIKALLASSFLLHDAAITGVRQMLKNGVFWNSAAAITSIKLLPGAGNFVTGSAFELWGQ